MEFQNENLPEKQTLFSWLSAKFQNCLLLRKKILKIEGFLLKRNNLRISIVIKILKKYIH